MAEAAPRRILHVDMDAFYASVEQREQPALRNQAVVVGGTPEGRGVVSAASYEARRFGVHSAMPAAIARRLCPHAEFIRPRMGFYARVSTQIREILGRYTPLIEPLALDEAFLDVTASERLFGSAPRIAAQIRQAIRAELDLPASVGVAGNKFLAKLACTLAKPDGIKVVEAGSVQEFLDPLSVSRLPGVGEAARASLARLRINTIADLRQADPERLSELFGSWGARLLSLARGVDPRPVVPDGRAKSISHETTFAHDISDIQVLRAWVFDLSEQVGLRARRTRLRGRTVRVKLRYEDFTTVSRARSLDHPFNDTATIAATANDMLVREVQRVPGALRLLGVGLAGFEQNVSPQIDLFTGEHATAASPIDHITDDIVRRFGPGAVSRARTLDK